MNVHFINRKNRKRRPIARVIVLASVITGLLVGGAYIVMHTDVFKIQKISITGTVHVQNDALLAVINEAVTKRRVAIFLGSDNLLAWPNTIAVENPYITALTVQKDFSNGEIVVAVTERERFGIWCFGEGREQCFWFGDNGILLGRAPETTGGLIITIRDPEGARGFDDRVLEETQMNIVKGILALFAASPELDAQTYTVKRKRQEFTIGTGQGTEFIFSLRFPVGNEIAAFIDEKRKTGEIQNFEYIDFTVEKRIYTK